MAIEGTENSPDEIETLAHLQLCSQTPATASQAAAVKKQEYSVQKLVVGAGYGEGCPHVGTE
jgi:hypothetical protein